ncbi:MAG: lycopene cyclase family protein [Thermomicrobiales bacterium]|jgi:lycopene beta-cyclase
MRRYDAIIAGGGVAGLTLAHSLVQSRLHDRSLLVIDQDAAGHDDHSLSYWSRQPMPFDAVVRQSWDTLRVTTGGRERVIGLGPYRYRTLRARDFTCLIRRELAAHPNVDVVTSVVERLDDGAEYAQAVAGGARYEGRWIFDSRWATPAHSPYPQLYYDARQSFVGAVIAAAAGAFDPSAVTFLDFRTSQRDGVRFFYVLPYSPHRAFIEYVALDADPPDRKQYQQALREYVETVLGITAYRVVAEEHGTSPMTDRPFPRRLGQRIMAIGALGGRIKPSSGFGITRIARDSAAIVQSLACYGHPFAVPPDPWRYRLYDSLLMEMVAHDPAAIERVFGALFARNPIERVFQFLDETGSLWANIRLIATMPPWTALRALPRAKVWRRLCRYGAAGC